MDREQTANPSDIARLLAATVDSLDRHANKQFTADESLYSKSVAYTARGFLDAFRSSLVNVAPVLSSWRRNAPVKHAGVSGASFHSVVCRLALCQYRDIWLRLDPESCCRWAEQRKSSQFDGLTGCEISSADIVENWDCLRRDLAELFADEAPIDGEFLSAGIDTEQAAVRTRCAMGGIPADHRTRAMSKREASKHLGRPNKDSGVKWLNQCIEDGTIACETLSAKSHVFDARQFPVVVQNLIRSDNRQ